MVYIFASTSKVSFSGSGIAAIAASEKNLADIRKTMTIQTIGYDKINQLRHVRYFKDINGLRAQMKKEADILRPKFEAVISTLEAELSGLGIGEWIKPKGGYFISFNTMEGCAKAVVAKCKEAGVVLTGAVQPTRTERTPRTAISVLPLPSPPPKKCSRQPNFLCSA